MVGTPSLRSCTKVSALVLFGLVATDARPLPEDVVVRVVLRNYLLHVAFNAAHAHKRLWPRQDAYEAFRAQLRTRSGGVPARMHC